MLEHYRQEGNKEKLYAAQFLLSNMKEHGYYDDGIIIPWQHLFRQLETLRSRDYPNSRIFDHLQHGWDSIVQIYGSPVQSKAVYHPDLTHLDADFILSSIEHSFFLRDSLPWCRELDFPVFLEYVLPYRITTEIPHDWKQGRIWPWKTTSHVICRVWKRICR